MPSNLGLQDYVRRARDHFVFVRLRAPNFPPEYRTNTAEQLAKLRHDVHHILIRTRNEDRRRWLKVVLNDLQDALNAYDSADRNRGVDRMYAAEEHFANAIH